MQTAVTNYLWITNCKGFYSECFCCKQTRRITDATNRVTHSQHKYDISSNTLTVFGIAQKCSENNSQQGWQLRTWSTLVFSRTDTSGARLGTSAGMMLLSDVRYPPKPPAFWINSDVWLNAIRSPFVLCMSTAQNTILQQYYQIPANTEIDWVGFNVPPNTL